MASKDIVTMVGELDVKKVYQALATILGDRAGIRITLKSVQKQDDKEKKTAVHTKY